MAADGWAVTFGTARRELGGDAAVYQLHTIQRCTTITFAPVVKSGTSEVRKLHTRFAP